MANRLIITVYEGLHNNILFYGPIYLPNLDTKLYVVYFVENNKPIMFFKVENVYA